MSIAHELEAELTSMHNIQKLVAQSHCVKLDDLEASYIK